jgi:hypothetical protein
MLPGSRLTQDKNNVMSISTTQKAMVTVDGTARSLARFREMKYPSCDEPMRPIVRGCACGFCHERVLIFRTTQPRPVFIWHDENTAQCLGDSVELSAAFRQNREQFEIGGTAQSSPGELGQSQVAGVLSGEQSN